MLASEGDAGNMVAALAPYLKSCEGSELGLDKRRAAEQLLCILYIQVAACLICMSQA